VSQPRGWERLAPWVAGIAAVIALVCLPTIVWQQFHYNAVERGYHQETISILNEHTDTLSEVHQLRVEVTNLIKLYGPDLTQGQQQIIAEYTWVACALQSGPAKCGAAPAP
jgi:hypothetical protein